MTRDLSRLLRPRSIAVLGGAWAANVVRACGRIGFEGEVWPVHPTRAELGGVPTVPRLADLPEPPDAAFLGINREATTAAVAELAAMGAGGAVAFSSGWAELGRAEAQDALVRAAGAMPLLGPNCYGLLNYLDGAAIWPDEHGGARVDRGVAIISQSSNVAITLTMQRRGLPLATVACLGNAAQTGAAELAGAMLDDRRVTALGLHLEGVGDAEALAAVAEEARARGLGVVALLGGRSEGGAAAAATHTAALAGGGAASSAFLRQAGVGEVRTLPELVEALKLLHLHGPLRGTRIVVASCSGGEAAMVADLAADRGLVFPPLTEAQRTRLGAALGPRVPLANPLDYHTYAWGDGAATAEVFTALLDGTDAGLFVIDPPRPDRCSREGFAPALAAIGAAARATGRPALAVATLPESLDEPLSASLLADGVVPLAGLDAALGAVEAAATPPPRPGWRPVPPVVAQAVPSPGPEAVASDRPPATPSPVPRATVSPSPSAPPPGPVPALDEAASKAWLRRAGIAVPRGVAAADLPGLRAGHLTPPLALKGLGLLHKTEAGAVRLGLPTLEGQAPMAGVHGYLAEEMVAGPRAELILGLRRDPAHGATLTLGLGGTAAELLDDAATLICPVGREEVEAALRSLRLWPLLDGHRGRPRPALGAALDAAGILQAAILADPSILEVEINPLILTATEAVAADAVVIRRLP